VQQYGGILACLPYFERAVHLGYPPAHSTLGSILEHGLYGLRVNYAQCYLHYTEAAKRGDAQGMVGLSRLNNRGLHGPGDDTQRRIALDESGWLAQREPNEESAFYWCQAAAEQDSPEGEFLLG
jgi:TPR repeat protein